jgi:hypothetical protein
MGRHNDIMRMRSPAPGRREPEGEKGEDGTSGKGVEAGYDSDALQTVSL